MIADVALYHKLMLVRFLYYFKTSLVCKFQNKV